MAINLYVHVAIIRNSKAELYIHCTSIVEPLLKDASLIRTHFIGPRVSVLKRFHCRHMYDHGECFLSFNLVRDRPYHNVPSVILM